MASCVLGIDTSNYTTSVACYYPDEQRFVQARRLLPVKEGELGLRQSDALFHHVQRLPQMVQELLAQQPLSAKDIAAIAVSARPRDVEGSYMPCFLAGLSQAEVLSQVLHVPLFQVSHQAGHVMAALASVHALSWLHDPFLAFHLSGGTTEALLVTPQPTVLFSSTLVAKTLDLNAGQLVDRVGKMLSLPFPAGKALEALANQFTGAPLTPKATIKGADCCLSGLENECKRLLERGEQPAAIACFCLDSIAKTLARMCKALREQYGELPMLFAGGVMSNQRIKHSITAQFPGVQFALPEFACDNACGVALLGAYFARLVV